MVEEGRRSPRECRKEGVGCRVIETAPFICLLRHSDLGPWEDKDTNQLQTMPSLIIK